MTNITNIPLLLLQSGCFTLTLVLALVLLISRFHLRNVNRGYETSRWLLIASLSLFAVHYLLQMIFGFRAKSEEVGALVNILFYAPSSFLMACATLCISTGHHYLRKFVIVGLTGITILYALFVTGLCIYGSLDMPLILRAMAVEYVALISFFVFNPGGELRRIHRKIEDETADDNSNYNLYMHTGTVLLYALGLIGTLSIFHTSTLVFAAVFFLVVLIFYVVSFISLGVSIQVVSSIVNDMDTQDDSEAPTASSDTTTTSEASGTPRLTPEQTEHITAAIAAWHAKQGYSTPNLTSVTMAQRLGISKRLLTQYLAEHEGSTFRVWLSNIRIEEAKRMLLTNAEYSIEAIAESCGFSSRSWMQEKFKASTGMTPVEWRESQKA